MFAIVTDHAHNLDLCLILPDKQVTRAVKAKATRELAKMDCKPLDGEKWGYSQVSPHWVLRRRPYRKFIKDEKHLNVYLVEDFHSDKIEHLITSDNQVIIVD